MKLGELFPALQARGHKCWRKEKHETQGAAQAQLRSLQKRGLLKNEQTAKEYQCPYCGAWHVGHSSRRETDQ